MLNRIFHVNKFHARNISEMRDHNVERVTFSRRRERLEFRVSRLTAALINSRVRYTFPPSIPFSGTSHALC